MTDTCTNCGRADELLESDGGLCARCADNRDYDHARAYRQIAASLGMEGKPVEEVVERVRLLVSVNATFMAKMDELKARTKP